MNNRKISPGTVSEGSKKTEISVGLILVSIGLLAAWEAHGFDSRSRVYPMVISSLLAASGAFVIISALIGKTKQQNISSSIRIAIPAVAILGLWVLALESGFGFVFPTLVMQYLLLWLGGVQGRLRRLLYSLLITIGAYLMFAVVLNVRLPIFSAIDIF